MFPLFFVVVIKYSIPYSMVLVNEKNADFADKKESRMKYFGGTIAGNCSEMSKFLLLLFIYSGERAVVGGPIRTLFYQQQNVKKPPRM